MSTTAQTIHISTDPGKAQTVGDLREIVRGMDANGTPDDTRVDVRIGHVEHLGWNCAKGCGVPATT